MLSIMQQALLLAKRRATGPVYETLAVDAGTVIVGTLSGASFPAAMNDVSDATKVHYAEDGEGNSQGLGVAACSFVDPSWDVSEYYLAIRASASNINISVSNGLSVSGPTNTGPFGGLTTKMFGPYKKAGGGNIPAATLGAALFILATSADDYGELHSLALIATKA